jgi:hypothetical protein
MKGKEFFLLVPPQCFEKSAHGTSVLAKGGTGKVLERKPHTGSYIGL